MFNATQYFAHLNSETPINSVAFYMQLGINLNSVSLPDVTSLNFRLSQSQLVQNLFEFQGGTSENQIEAVDHIQMIDSDTARVDAAIILVAFPPDTYYPIDIHMNIRALLVSSTGGSVIETSQAIGSIVRAPGMCNSVKLPMCHTIIVKQVRVTLLLVKMEGHVRTPIVLISLASVYRVTLERLVVN